MVKLSDGSNVGHVPDPFARVLAPMLDGGKIERMEGTVTGVSQDLHLKASGFLVEGLSFLVSTYCTVRKGTAKT